MVRQVRCVNASCPRVGIIAVVADKLVARGVVARPTLHCAECDFQVADVRMDLVPPTPVPRQLPTAAKRKRPPARARS